MHRRAPMAMAKKSHYVPRGMAMTARTRGLAVAACARPPDLRDMCRCLPLTMRSSALRAKEGSISRCGHQGQAPTAALRAP